MSPGVDRGNACAPPLGLRRYAVRLVDHRPEWAGLLTAEAERVREVCGESVVAVHHAGTTAVPDLLARPTIDGSDGEMTKGFTACVCGEDVGQHGLPVSAYPKVGQWLRSAALQ